MRTINDVESAKLTNVKPIQKLCHTCRIFTLKLDELEISEEIEISDNDYELQRVMCRENVSSDVTSLLCSPLKSVSSGDKVNYGKRLLHQIA